MIEVSGMQQDLLKSAQETSQLIESVGHPQAADIGADLTWAVFNLEAARVGSRMLELLGSEHGQGLMELFDSRWEALETSGMSLGFGDAVTAIDLCADALYLAADGEPLAGGRFKDVNYWRPESLRSRLQPMARHWIDGLLADSQWDELSGFWRAAITHRRLARHIAMNMSEPDGAGGRSLSRIGLPGTSAESGPDVLTKVTELLDFATNEVRGCCVALTADYVH